MSWEPQYRFESLVKRLIDHYTITPFYIVLVQFNHSNLICICILVLMKVKLSCGFEYGIYVLRVWSIDSCTIESFLSKPMLKCFSACWLLIDKVKQPSIEPQRVLWQDYYTMSQLFITHIYYSFSVEVFLKKLRRLQYQWPI